MMVSQLLDRKQRRALAPTLPLAAVLITSSTTANAAAVAATTMTT